MRTRWLLRPPAETYQTLLLGYAVGTVLVVRLYLRLTGYPQVGTGSLHVAHLLWGGALMLIGGNVLLIAYGKGARRVGAIALGVGFGLFVDEVGKFVTRDNDYFYRPAAAIIYTTFVALYIAYQAVRRLTATTDRVLLMEAVEALEEVVRGDFDVREQALALQALDRAAVPGSRYAPLAQALHAIVARQSPLPIPPPPRAMRWLYALRDRLTARPDYRTWLVRVISAGALLFLAKTLLQALFVFGLVFNQPLVTNRLDRLLSLDPEHATAAVLETVASLLAATYAARGILLLRRDLDHGLRLLSRAFLLLILVADVFSFYVAQFSAAVDALLNLAFLTSIHNLRTGTPLDRGEPATANPYPVAREGSARQYRQAPAAVITSRKR